MARRSNAGAAEGTPRRSRRRWVWRGVVGAGLLLVLVAGAAVALTQTALLKAIVLPRLGEALRVEAGAQSVVLDADGSVLIRRLELRNAEIEGPARELLAIDRVRARVAWGALLRGELVLRDLELERPMGRISIEQRSGALNVAPLFASTGDTGRATIPSVRLQDAMIQFGEHDGDGFTLLKSVAFDGELRRRAGEGFDITLVEHRDSGVTAPLVVQGGLDAQRVELELERVALEDFPSESIPTSIREGFRLLDLQGAVSGATLTYAPAEGVAVEIALADVAITLPFDREGNLARTGDMPRMTQVTGALAMSRGGFSASLSGMLEDLPYDVTLDYRGTTMESPFRATLATDDFVLSEHPRLLPYIPAEIEEALRAFSSPTATIDAEVTLSRGLAEWADPDRVVIEGGFARFEKGFASLDQFPYPFSDIEGLILFDGDAAEIREARGVASSGAELRMRGEIAPLNNRPAIHLEFELRDLPIDEALRAAAPEDRRWLVEEIFSLWRLGQLRERGLVGGEGPEVELGGNVDIRAVVDLAGAGEQPWVEATVSAGRLVALPQKFAVPLVAEDVVLRATPLGAQLEGGTFRTIEGQEVTITAHLDLSEPRREGVDPVPTVVVGAQDVRPTPLVLNAIAQAGEPREPRADLESMLLGLNASGEFDVEIRVGARADGSAGFDALATFEGVSVRPAAGGGDGVLISGVRGEVHASERLIGVDATAREPAPLRVRTRVQTASDAANPFRVEVLGERVDLAMPFASIVGVFSGRGAEELRRLSEAHRPEGSSDVAVRVWRNAGERDAHVEVALASAAHAAFDHEPGRVGVDDLQGQVRYSPDWGVRFDAAAADLAVGGRPAGRVGLDGGWPLGIASSADVVVPPLDVTLERTPVDHPLANWLAQLRLGEVSVRQMQEVLTGGRFDLEATISHLPGGGHRVVGSIRPDRLRIRRGERELVLREVEGGVDLGPGGAVSEELRGRIGGWDVTLQGVVEPLEDGGFAVTGSLLASGPALDEDAWALLPVAVSDIARAIDLRAPGVVELSIPDLSMELAPDGEVRSVAAAGRTTLSAASADVGVRLEEMAGTLHFRYEREGVGAPPEFLVELEAPSLLASGLRLHDPSAEIASTGERGRVWIRTFEARTHDGRLVGHAMLDGPRDASEAPWRYSASVRMSDVRVAPALEELRGVADGGSAGAVEPPLRDGSRGLLSGEVSLAGVIGDRSSRRGRGSAQVGQGHVLDLPLLMPLLEVANLQLPSSAPVDLAMAEFFVEGERVTFEELSAFAGGVEIYGFGTLELTDYKLDLRFASRAVRPIPVLGQLVEGLKNELVGLRVEGTLQRPAVVPETLRGTRALLSRLVGAPASVEEQEMARIERELSNRRERVRRASERMRRLAATAPESPAGDGD